VTRGSRRSGEADVRPPPAVRAVGVQDRDLHPGPVDERIGDGDRLHEMVVAHEVEAGADPRPRSVPTRSSRAASRPEEPPGASRRRRREDGPGRRRGRRGPRPSTSAGSWSGGRRRRPTTLGRDRAPVRRGPSGGVARTRLNAIGQVRRTAPSIPCGKPRLWTGRALLPVRARPLPRGRARVLWWLGGASSRRVAPFRHQRTGRAPLRHQRTKRGGGGCGRTTPSRSPAARGSPCGRGDLGRCGEVGRRSAAATTARHPTPEGGDGRSRVRGTAAPG